MREEVRQKNQVVVSPVTISDCLYCHSNNITKDGLRSYADAYNKEFRTQQGQRTVHIKQIRLQGQRNNNKMERLNGEFRDREKVVRGIKKQDSVMFDGYQMFHNYLRPHMGLDGKTPSEACGIEIKGKDKWKTLIENSVLEMSHTRL